jgi:tRNA threonylcarbamoyladenosine biosynthesis protein TsaB
VHVLILSLDTSSPTGSVAAHRDGHLLGVVSTATDETYSSRIFRQLEFLLAELRLELQAFDVFAVNAGPGSFTGVRVGLASAKAWGEAFSRPVVPISGLEALATQAMGCAGPIVPAIDARRGQVYAGMYRSAPDQGAAADRVVCAGGDMVMPPEEFVAWLYDTPELAGATLATPSPEWLHSLLSASNRVATKPDVRAVSPVLAPILGQLAFHRVQRGEVSDALHLDANYIRRCDAEVKWREK